MAIPLNASFQNNRNNGYATAKQASTLFEIGEFLVYNGLGQVIPYDGTELIVYSTLVGGPFTVGETITGGTSTATGVVVTDNGTDSMTINTVTGTFVVGETITGGTSGATAVIDLTSGPRNKILGLSNEQITAASSNFATAEDINISTPVNILDFLDIPVTVGTATIAMVGSYFDVDVAEPGALDVSAPGSQILVTRVIDADNVVGVIALKVA